MAVDERAVATGRPVRRLPSAGRAVVVLSCVLALTACKREQRQFREAPPAATSHTVAVSDLHPGGGSPLAPAHTPLENNAYAVSEGKRLYESYNCVGCHSHGGGGMGPALRDDEWIYGHEADQIYHSILEGRPNGMPAWAGKIPDYQIWEIVAYVRSMSGLLPKDVAPGRDDHMTGPPPESSTPRLQPKNAGPSPSQVH